MFYLAHKCSILNSLSCHSTHFCLWILLYVKPFIRPFLTDFYLGFTRRALFHPQKNLNLLNQTFKLLNECMTFFFMNNCLTQNQLLDARLPFDNRPHPSLSHNVRHNCSKSKIPASASISITDFFGKIMKKSGDPFRAP